MSSVQFGSESPVASAVATPISVLHTLSTVPVRVFLLVPPSVRILKQWKKLKFSSG